MSDKLKFRIFATVCLSGIILGLVAMASGLSAFRAAKTALQEERK